MDSVLQWNINGLKTHLNDLKIKVKDTNPKVIAIQESHLKTEENFEFNGYVSVRKDYDGGQQACVSTFQMTSLPKKKTSFILSLNSLAPS
ncbi:hypothetical protein M8J76_005155 [Diaphorina citri]|nr:hypothetical protein M8J76_005155 [Diaphorina citri]